MKEARSTPNLRKSLDERFRKKWRRAARDKRPEQGWVREIREALGMSSRQLALRAGMQPTSVVKFERAERQDVIQLKTLRKLGKALGCELVYALVPGRPLDRILRDRAFGILLPEIMIPAAQMKMNIPTFVVTELIDMMIAKGKMLDRPHALWDEPKEKKGYSMKAILAQLEKTIIAQAATRVPSPTPPPTPAPPPPPEAPSPQKPTGECPAHLKHIEDWWRRGIVEE